MKPTVAVIGGGPAGAVCAWRLAEAGVRTLLFERQPDREKPCGGGLTERAFRALPELANLGLPWVEAREWRLYGPRHQRVDLALDPPIRVVPRRELDGALRRRAVKAGAAFLHEPVRELNPHDGGGWQVNDHAADLVVGAGGMQDPLAKHLGLALEGRELAMAVGRYVPGRFEPRLITQFFPEVHGYAWWFPREDHASLGIVLPAEHFDLKQARQRLDQFAAANLPGIDANAGQPYGWLGPAIQDWAAPQRRFAGPDWLLVGDAAGLCDGTTGEGISYALASGQLAAQAIVQQDPLRYELRLRADIVPDLAKSARLQTRFYRPHRLAAAMWLLRRSRTLQQISRELAHGRQDYLTLSRRLREATARVLWETLTKS
jgi:geranylgeranyl reductase family protein